MSKISRNFNDNISMNFLLLSTHQDFFQNTFTTLRVLVTNFPTIMGMHVADAQD